MIIRKLIGFHKAIRLADLPCNKEVLIENITEMYLFAVSKGALISPEIAQMLDSMCFGLSRSRNVEAVNDKEVNFLNLLELHNKLAKLIAPITPSSLRVTKQVCCGLFINNAIINILMILALICLVLFLYCSLGIKYGSESISYAAIEALNAVSAAGLGASFYTLFTARKYILNRTYKVKYNQSYVIRFILGLVAGSMLGIYGNNILGQEMSDTLGPGILAILGGFSSDAVYQILQRLSDTLVTVVQGSDKEVLQAKEQILTSENIMKRSRERREMLKRFYDIKEKALQNNASREIIEEAEKAIEDITKKEMDEQ